MRSKNINIKNKALEFLARREYGYHELFNKLQKYTDNLDEIQSILKELQQKGWLSEERYISNFIESKKSKYGLLKIRYNLQQKQVNPEVIEQILKQNPIDEYEAALKIWQKKFGTTAKDSNERMRQIRFLQNRGFSYDLILKVIKAK